MCVQADLLVPLALAGETNNNLISSHSYIDLPNAKADESVENWVASPVSPDNANGRSFANYRRMSVPDTDEAEPSKGARVLVASLNLTSEYGIPSVCSSSFKQIE